MPNYPFGRDGGNRRFFDQLPAARSVDLVFLDHIFALTFAPVRARWTIGFNTKGNVDEALNFLESRLVAPMSVADPLIVKFIVDLIDESCHFSERLCRHAGTGRISLAINYAAISM